MVPLAIVCLVVLMSREGSCSSECPPHNVGSVLFFSPDIKRPCWYKEDIALLRSRHILQSILPPKDYFDINDEGYVEFLLHYFNHGFHTAMKHAELDPNGGLILQAMADTVGGYLKSWALPLTRFGYYAGTVSYAAVRKLTDYYEDIKLSLMTDGYSWCLPNHDIFKSLNLTIAPLAIKHSNNARACKQLVFYETPSSEFLIPMPHINWDYQPYMMMVPLKTRSLVALQSPDSAYILYDYFVISQRCLLERRSKEQKTDFESRFRRWVAEDIIPHLRDDTLYVAFGSVFRLLNGTIHLNSLFTFDVPQNKRYSGAAMKKNYPNLYRDDYCSYTDRLIRLIIRDSPVFLAALLLLWCGPCLLFCFAKRFLRKWPHDDPQEESTTILHSHRHSRRKRPARRYEHHYPCEVVYSGKKTNRKTSFADSSKTSSDIKSKTSELLFKVSRANNVNSINFEKESQRFVRNNSITKNVISKSAMKLKQSTKVNSVSKLDLEENRFSEIINYYSNACTNSEDLVAGESQIIDIPTSVSTLVQNDCQGARESITDCSNSTAVSISDLETASKRSIRSYPDIKSVIEVAAPADTQECLSSRKEHERPTRIPQKQKSTVKPRSFLRAPTATELHSPRAQKPPHPPTTAETESGN